MSKPTALDFVSFAFDAQRDYEATKPLFIDAQVPDRSLNSIQARSLVRRLVSGFRAAGLGKGEGVLVSVSNNYLYAALLYGIIGFGGIACGVNAAYKFEELDHLTRQFEPKSIIATQESLPTVLAVAQANKIPINRIFLLDDLAAPLEPISVTSDQEYNPSQAKSNSSLGNDRETRSFTDLLHHGESDWMKLHSEEVVKTTPAIFYPTSGTSGLPKLAMLSHQNLIEQHRAIYRPVPYDVVRMLCLPCFHMFGAAWLMACPLRYGEPAYIMQRFHLETYLRNLSRFGATEAYITPPIVHMLNKTSLPVRELMSTVRWTGVGGAPIDAGALRRFQQAALQPCTTLSQIGIACLFHYGDKDVDLAAVGRLQPGYHIKLVDPETGREVAAEEQVPAELLVRSPNIMMGYKATPSPREEGSAWFPTGDLVEVRNGRFYIVGRNKELIKTRGWQVAPAEVEGVIMQHPGVSDCAVVGVSSSDGTTEVPRAYVIRKDPGAAAGVTCDDVYNIVKTSLASYKRLEGGVVFVDTIPRTASGKTQRFKLVGMAAASSDGAKPAEKKLSLAEWARKAAWKFVSTVKQML
ncbi:uncharacterized protein PG998_005179 [Apiospora kogelbergensis]|uniref:uncharacterized protein n=1 Tax=Apiospora kogelbergensis TaxID=1337665 RepID=UPI00312DD4DA